MTKSYNILKYLVLTCLLIGAFPATATCTTHTPLLEPASLVSDSSYQLAKTWFLPDWQSDTRSYNTNAGNNDDGGGDVEKTCETYGYASPGSVDLNLYDCSDYDIKPLYGLKCYTGCVCKPKFIYTSSNCNTSAGYTLSGLSCGGKYESCVCSRECCSDSMCGSNETCQNGSCVSLDPCTGITCGTNEVCSNGSCICASGYKSCNGTCISNSSCCTNSDCGNNQTCSNGVCNCSSGYNSCNGTCISNSSCCTDSDCGADETCSNGSCTSTCSYTITAADCSSECKSAGSSSCVRGGTTYYASCGASKCGSDQSCSNGTCVDNCTPLNDEENCKWGTKNCSDNCGGYRSCCKTAAEYCTENGYKSGVTCEKGQTTETCPADSGYKKCSGNGCPASQTCTYGCKTYSSQSGCSDVCTACYSDNCRNRTAVTVPANASCSAYYNDCPSKCSAWACNTNYYQDNSSCKHNDCKATPVNVPSNGYCSSTNSCNICTAWSCNGGYVDTEGYWCSVPETTDCSALGYNKSGSDCTDKNKIYCPFDNSKFACF